VSALIGEYIQKRVSELFDVDPLNPDVQELAWVIQKMAADLREGKISSDDVKDFLKAQSITLRGLARRCSSKEPEEVLAAVEDLVEEVASIGLRGVLGRMYELHKMGQRRLGRRQTEGKRESRELL